MSNFFIFHYIYAKLVHFAKELTSSLIKMPQCLKFLQDERSLSQRMSFVFEMQDVNMFVSGVVYSWLVNVNFIFLQRINVGSFSFFCE